MKQIHLRFIYTITLFVLSAGVINFYAPKLNAASENITPLLTSDVVQHARPAWQQTEVVTLTVIHTNDIYEIIPVGGGKLGGLTRLATLKKQLLAQNPHTIMTFSGDLYGPSGMSNAVVDGVPLDGLQAVKVMNKVGINYMTFGDHEFNAVTSEANFWRNMVATEFPMVSSNVFSKSGQPLAWGNNAVKMNDIFTITQNSQSVRVGVFAVTKPIGRAAVPYSQTNIYSATAIQVAELRNKVDILIALTHLPIASDLEMARRYPEINLILGADEHQYTKVVTNGVQIYKADSNSRSAYIINLAYNLGTKKLNTTDYLQEITDVITEDAETKVVSDQWVKIAFDGFRTTGAEPTEVIATTPVDLDGFATSVRNYPTELTKLLMRGVKNAVPTAQASIDVAALIRLDDLIPAGSKVTMYDALRGFPIDSQLVSTKISGAVLKKSLDDGMALMGSGLFVQKSEDITQSGSSWLFKGKPIDDSTTYVVATSEVGFDTLFSGISPLPEMQVVTETLRSSFIKELRAEFSIQRTYLPLIVKQN